MAAFDLRALFRSDDDNAKRQMVKDVDELFKAAQEDRKSYEPQWLTNMAFFFGKQTLEWDETLRKMKDIKEEMPWWRPVISVNLIKSSVITQYAKILAHKPAATVEPDQPSPEGEQTARFSDKYLEWQWPRMRKDALKRRAVMWDCITGTALGKVFWDPHTGDVLREPDTLVGDDGMEFPNPRAGQARKLKDGRPLRIGDVQAIAVSPFEFYPEPLAESIEEMQHCFHVKVRSKAYVREKYGVEIEEENLQPDELVGARVAEMIDPRAQANTKGVLVKEFFERSSISYPEGRYVVYAGERLLNAGPNPYPKWQIPFVAMTFYPVVGRFWGTCSVDDEIDLQRNYNKARQQAIEIRNLMGKPQWLIPDNALDDGYEITSAPGQQITYTPGPNGEKPEMVQGKEVPASYFQDMQQTRQELFEVSGQHEPSHATGTPQLRTATAFALAQESDDTRLGPSIESFEGFIQKMEEGTLILTKQYYSEPRLISLAGEDGSVEVMHFEASSIPDDVRVRVQSSNALPRSRVARQEYIRGLWKDGLLGKDPRTPLKLLEFGEIEGVYDDINADQRQAERENRRMRGDPEKELAPTAVPVRDFHNHPIHKAEHDKHRKSEAYELSTPEEQAIFDQHVLDHEMYMLAAPPIDPDGEVAPGVPTVPGGAEPEMPEAELLAQMAGAEADVDPDAALALA